MYNPGKCCALEKISMGKLKSYSTVSRPHLATTRLATQMTNVSALMRCQRRYVFTSKFTLFKNKPQNIRAGGLQIISTPQLPLAMSPGLCLSATEMALPIIPSEKTKLKNVLKTRLLQNLQIQEWLRGWAFPWWLLQALWKTPHWTKVGWGNLLAKVAHKIC